MRLVESKPVYRHGLALAIGPDDRDGIHRIDLSETECDRQLDLGQIGPRRHDLTPLRDSIGLQLDPCPYGIAVG